MTPSTSLAGGAFRSKPVLVCGGAGFIGSWITDLLVEAGADVTVIDPCVSRTGGRSEHLHNSVNRIHWLRKPIEMVEQLPDLLKRSALVIDAMGFVAHHEGMTDPRFDLQCNYLSHLSLIEALRTVPVPVVYLGSRGQYGRLTGSETLESSAQAPLDPQGVHKAAAESMFRIYSASAKFRCLSIRVGNCFGPRQPALGRDIGLIGGFIRSLLAGEQIELFGDSSRTRHLIFVKDLARMVLELASRAPSEGFQAVNLVGEPVSMKSTLDSLITSIGRGSYRVVPFPAEVARMDPGETVISQELARSCLGELNFTPLETALAETLDYFRKGSNQ